MRLLKISIISVSSFYIMLCLLVYFFQEKILFQPEKLPAGFSYTFSFPFDERQYKMDDATINALHFTTRNPKGVILYFHGNAGNLSSWGYASGRFLGMGYDLVMIDYRGYGKSTGIISEKNLFHDALFIYDSLVREYGEHQLHVYGRSIGSGIAAYVASQRTPVNCILEAPFYSMIDLIRHVLPVIPPFVIRYPMRTDIYVTQITCPVYLFHGTKDTLIYFGSSIKLAKKLQPPSGLFAIPEGGHNNLSHYAEYTNKLRHILE
ncbi:MAG: alpha/beta hydrolase [Spirochaetales bacterium]|nr:alpha/beta hydrolase [Spirochaetales bacterium]